MCVSCGIILSFDNTGPSRGGLSLRDRVLEETSNRKKREAKERKGGRMGKRKENFGREGPPRESCEIARNGFSHAAGALYHLMRYVRNSVAPYGGEPITCATRKPCHGKAPASAHPSRLFISLRSRH